MKRVCLLPKEKPIIEKLAGILKDLNQAVDRVRNLIALDPQELKNAKIQIKTEIAQMTSQDANGNVN